MPTPSKETLLLQAVWKKAAKADAPLRIESASPQAAQQLRLRFYSAVKRVRTGQETDAELEAAVANCSLRIDPDARRWLIIGLRSQMRPEETAQLEAIAGAKASELRSASEVEADESLARFLAKADGPQETVRPPNPYYTRG